MERERAPIPGSERQGATPSVAPRAAPLSAANLLAIQRSAGNQAALAIMRSTLPSPSGGAVIRRVWEDGFANERWHEAIVGVRWNRTVGEDGTVAYWYTLGDGADPALEGEEFEEHTAEWWAAWEHAPNPWFAALSGGAADEAPAPGPVVAPELAVPELADQPAEHAVAAEEPAQPVVAAYHGPPTVTSGGTPQYAPGGAFSWPVTMATIVAALPTTSWIIQKVDLDIEGERTTFYEAFPVPAGQTAAANSDVYLNPEAGSDSGTSSVRGVMQHHVFAGDGYPPGFAQGIVEESDGEQWSSYAQPDFWVAGQGTAHALEVTWNDDDETVTLTTVPATAAFTRVDSAADFG